MLRITYPTTRHERQETITILGKDVAYELGILPKKVEEGLIITNLGKDAAYKHDLLPKKVEEGLIVTEAQYFPEAKSYQRQERLNAFLKII
jgi:hypothetical protein